MYKIYKILAEKTEQEEEEKEEKKMIRNKTSTQAVVQIPRL